MSKKVVKKKNVPAGSSADSSDADVVTPSELEAVASPADLDGGAPLREEDDPDDNEKPSPPHNSDGDACLAAGEGDALPQFAMEPEASLKLEDEGCHVGVETWAGLKLEVEAPVLGAGDCKPEIGDIRVKIEPDDVPVLRAGDLKQEVGDIRVKIEPDDGGEGEDGHWAFAQPCAQRLEVEVMMDDPLNAGAHDVKVERDCEASLETRTFVDVEVVVDHIGRCGGDVKVKRDDGEADVSTKARMDVGAPVDDNGH
ncbi:unnamed protein product, partial [Lampetra fluviatilis]